MTAPGSFTRLLRPATAVLLAGVAITLWFSAPPEGLPPQVMHAAALVVFTIG